MTLEEFQEIYDDRRRELRHRKLGGTLLTLREDEELHYLNCALVLLSAEVVENLRKNTPDEYCKMAEVSRAIGQCER